MNDPMSMLRTHPRAENASMEALAACVRECFACGSICTTCADACLGEPNVSEMVRCIRLNLDCAAVCLATGQVVARLTEVDDEVLRAQLEACRVACEQCGEECERHAAHMEHCRLCAEACRSCAEACRQLLTSLPMRA